MRARNRQEDSTRWVNQTGDRGADELLDVVEPTGAQIARLPRSKVHSEALWHQVFHCLVVRSGLPARVLLQRRKSSSRAFAGMIDLSATGHLLAGERPLDGVREFREETGLVVDEARLVSLGRRLLADDCGEGRNREVAHGCICSQTTHRWRIFSSIRTRSPGMSRWRSRICCGCSITLQSRFLPSRSTLSG